MDESWRESTDVDEEMEEEDIPFPSVTAEDNPEWLALIAKAKLEGESRRKKKRGRHCFRTYQKELQIPLTTAAVYFGD